MKESRCDYYIDTGKTFGFNFTFFTNSADKESACSNVADCGKELCP